MLADRQRLLSDMSTNFATTKGKKASGVRMICRTRRLGVNQDSEEDGKDLTLKNWSEEKMMATLRS